MAASTLINDTIAWNFIAAFTDRGAAEGQGAGVYNASSNNLTLQNTIIAKDQVFSNSAASTTQTFNSDLFGNAASSDHDLIGVKHNNENNLVNGTNGDQVGSDGTPIDPKLIGTSTSNALGLVGLAPVNHGGLTPTFTLDPSSPAIAQGNPNAVTAIALAEGVPTTSATDQNGFAAPKRQHRHRLLANADKCDHHRHHE